MKNRVRTSLPIVAIALFLMAALIVSPVFNLAPELVQGAPAPAPTPITQYQREDSPRIVEFWGSATALTADTRSTCYDLAGYNNIDIHYIIDQGTVNTTTVTLEHSNNNSTYPDGINVVASNAADADVMQQYPLFGKWTCLYANLTNANTFTITAIGLAK